MDGFVADYISAFTAEQGRPPGYEEYAQIMTGYTPGQVPVISAIARGFATFDHWHCEVPSQTFANRSFYHAASSSGFVINTPYENFPLHNHAATIFERLDAADLPWRVYVDPGMRLSITGLIHATQLWKHFATRFSDLDDFFDDAEHGRLPAYSFIEPSLIRNHNDYHPPVSSWLLDGDAPNPPSPNPGRGEPAGPHLLGRARVGDRRRLQLRQHAVPGDVRRARRDLRPCPAATGRPAPCGRPARPDGVRVQPGRGPYPRPGRVRLHRPADRRHPPLRQYLADRDAARPVEPRAPADRPRRHRARHRARLDPRHPPAAGRLAGGHAPAVPQQAAPAVPPDRPLPQLGQHLLGAAIALDALHNGHVAGIDPKTATSEQALGYLNDRAGALYPGLAPRPT